MGGERGETEHPSARQRATIHLRGEKQEQNRNNHTHSIHVHSDMFKSRALKLPIEAVREDFIIFTRETY